LRNGIGFAVAYINKTTDQAMITLFIILTTLLNLAPQQNLALDPNNDFRGIGSAKTLSGKTYVLVLFVSQEGKKEWGKTEKSAIMKKVKQATGWISDKTKKFGKSNSFSVYSLGKKNDIKLRYIPSGPYERLYSNDVINQAMIAAGYVNNAEFLDYVQQKAAYDNCLVLVFSNTQGLSYALPLSRISYQNNIKSGCPPNQLEGCVVFNKYTDGRNIAAPTIAHEILHLFGAIDLYDTKGNKQRDETLKKHFPNSIMRRVNYTFNNLEIDPFTAYQTGLTDNYKE